MTTVRKLSCPSCKVVLKIAATVATGKRIRCPKCSHVFALAGAAESSPAPRPAAVRSRPAPIAHDPDDFLQEEDERPRGRKPLKKGKKARRRRAVLVFAIGGAVLLLGATVTLAVMRPWEANKQSASSKNAPEVARRLPEPPVDPQPGKPRKRVTPVGSDPSPGPDLAGQGPGKESAESAPVQDGQTDSESQKVAAGRKVYESLDCARCHSLGAGPGGAVKKGRGPSLSHVGADAGHTVQWLSEQIRNPKSHRPNSRMPAYDRKVNADDLKSLAEYLASLK